MMGFLWPCKKKKKKSREPLEQTVPGIKAHEWLVLVLADVWTLCDAASHPNLNPQKTAINKLSLEDIQYTKLGETPVGIDILLQCELGRANLYKDPSQ